MATYMLAGEEVDSIELKCMVVSRGMTVDKAVYKAFKPRARLSESPLNCNCMILADGTIVQLTDMGFHLNQVKSMFSLSTLKMMKYAKDLTSPFKLELVDGEPTITYEGTPVTTVRFPEKNAFYEQTTRAGLPYAGNAVLQGVDWVAFQCLWPCEFGAAGKPCEFCYSGGEFAALARKGKPMPPAVPVADFTEIVTYALDECGVNSIQITGGSTFDGRAEAEHIRAYLTALRDDVGLERFADGDILLYITPPADLALIDEYFELGATRIACSLELWDEERAATVTPGKIAFTTRQRHLDALEYIAEHYGKNKAFSNFIIGIESLETLEEGARYLASRGIIPTASTWMPQGAPVMGSMKAPDVAYYRKVKELFGQLYVEYGLEPAGGCGLNVCTERDIWRAATGACPPRTALA